MSDTPVNISTMPDERAACAKIIQTLSDHHLTLDAGIDALAMTIVIMMQVVKMKSEEAHYLADELAHIIKANYHLNVEPLQ